MVKTASVKSQGQSRFPATIWIPIGISLLSLAISAAALYGATSALTTETALETLFETMTARLERSDIVFEFLAIMRSASILPLPLRPVQHLLVRAAIDLVPRWLRTIVGLNERGLYPWEASLVRRAGAFADRIVLEASPAVQACRRMRLPADYLYIHDSVPAANIPPFRQIT